MPQEQPELPTREVTDSFFQIIWRHGRSLVNLGFVMHSESLKLRITNFICPEEFEKGANHIGNVCPKGVTCNPAIGST